MITRELRLPRDRSCLLFGPRQSGKSTFIRASLPPESWSVDLLEQATYLRLAKEPGRFRRECEQQIAAGTTTILVDEVQKLPALLDEVHALIESTGARFLLTGSSARKLKRGGANLLAGRASIRRLHPLTIGEIGADFDLERVLRFGSLPAVVTGSDETAVELLSSYAETYLREEIQNEGVVRNLGSFARFLDIAAAQDGQILNAESIARDTAISGRTVRDHFQILEDTLIGMRLEAWRKSPRARLVAHSRFYLFDPGVTNALCRRLHAPLDAVTRGHLFEQWVVNEARRCIDYRFPETRLFYWRTNHGAEVDLLFERHGALRLAVEIKSRRTVVGADLAGMRSFHEAHPEVPLAVVATVPEPYRLDEVEVLPYAQFFRELGRWLEPASAPS